MPGSWSMQSLEHCRVHLERQCGRVVRKLPFEAAL